MGKEESRDSGSCGELVYKQKFLRLLADFDNYKKRTEKDRIGWIVNSQIAVIKSFLFIIDDIERAMESVEKSQQSTLQKDLISGLAVIKKNVDKAFGDLGVEEVNCSVDFDPNLHEALVQEDSLGIDSGKIISVLSRGYKFANQVIRHAKVSVAK